jgi:tetratricopeptide (TPR) repeat protein
MYLVMVTGEIQMTSQVQAWSQLIREAETLMSKFRFADAEGRLYAAMNEASHFGQSDQRYIYTLDKLSECMWHQGKLVEAENYCKQLIRIHEDSKDVNPLDIASYLNNLALIKHLGKKFEEAEKYYKRALKTKETMLGSNNQLVLRLRSNYADMLRQWGRKEEAQSVSNSTRVVTVRDWQSSSQVKSLEQTKFLPIVDPWGAVFSNTPTETVEQASEARIVITLDEAKLLWRANKEASINAFRSGSPLVALRLWEFNAKILESLVPVSAQMVEALETLSDISSAMNDDQSAIHYRQRAYKLLMKMNGPLHEFTVRCADKLARLCYQISDYEQAEPYAIQCVDAYRDMLGPRSRQYACALHNLALLYHVQRRYDLAEELYRESLDIKIEVFGEEHEETTRLMRAYSDVLEQNNKHDELSKLDKQRRRAGQIITGSWKSLAVPEDEALLPDAQ